MFHSLKRSREEDSEPPLDPKKFRSWQPTPNSSFLPEPTDLDQSLRFRAPTLTPIDSSDDEDSQKSIKHGFHPSTTTSTTTQLAHPRPSNLHLNLTSNPHPARLLLSGDDLSPWQQAHVQGYSHNSPISQALINHSLDINESALTAPGFGHDDYESTPILTPNLNPNPALAPSTSLAHPQFHSQFQSDTQMEDITPSTKDLPAIRLPSPVSDTDMAMADPVSDHEPEPEAKPGYPYRIPTPGLDYGNVSPQPGAAHPMSRSASKNSTTSTHTPTPTPCPVPHRRSALVMGYRADCDKCRCKVPGHYSHIIERAC